VKKVNVQQKFAFSPWEKQGVMLSAERLQNGGVGQAHFFHRLF
jgi:hypothetical protein